MVDVLYPVDAVTGSPSYGGRMLRQVNAVAFGGATAARPLGGRSGVRPGTSATTVTATSTTWTCGPLSGVADVETAAEAGLVTFAFDANATGAITAASASFARQDLIYVQIDIPVEDGSAVPVVTRKYVAGTVALTDPPLPVSRAFAIARINVPISGGGSPTVTWIAPYAVAAGGILPVPSSASYPASPYVGQQVDDAALGYPVRWSGSGWSAVAGATANRVLVYRTSGVNLPANTVFPIPWIAEYWDVRNMHAPNVEALVAPIDGVYAVDYQIDVSTTTITSAAWIASNVAGHPRFATSEGVVKNHTGSARIPLLAGQTVVLNMFSNTLVAVATSAAQSSFGMTWAGAY